MQALLQLINALSLLLLLLLQVTDALGKLIFTLVSMLFIAAGIFYELEKFAVSFLMAADAAAVPRCCNKSQNLSTHLRSYHFGPYPAYCRPSAADKKSCQLHSMQSIVKQSVSVAKK
jgi:hypothetical protein